MSTWSNITIPAEPSPKLVYVSNISTDATEDKVREFFLFCGNINQFELKKSSNGKTQEALILFEKESAAKTASMLSNAVIADTQIHVRYYFDKAFGSGQENETAAKDSLDSDVNTQEAKPKTGIVTEVIAAGFQVTDVVVQRAKHFDATYGVSSFMTTYYQQALEKIGQLDEQYQIRKTVTEKAGALDAQYHVSEKVTAATQAALQSAPGQVAQGVIAQAKGQVEGARQLADERKAQAAAAVEEDKANPVPPPPAK